MRYSLVWLSVLLNWERLSSFWRYIKLANLTLVHVCACLTHWGRDKWTPFRRRHFQCIFLNENVWIPIKISLRFVPKVPINTIPVLVQILAWRRSGDKPLSEPMMVSLLTHICVTRPQWVNNPFPPLKSLNVLVFSAKVSIFIIIIALYIPIAKWLLVNISSPEWASVFAVLPTLNKTYNFISTIPDDTNQTNDDLAQDCLT